MVAAVLKFWLDRIYSFGDSAIYTDHVAAIQPICTRICVIAVLDVITSAKFGTEISNFRFSY